MSKVNSSAVVEPVTALLVDQQEILTNALLQQEMLIKRADDEGERRYQDLLHKIETLGAVVAHLASGFEGTVQLGRVRARVDLVVRG